MKYSKEAKILGVSDLLKMMEDEYRNPTIQRMVFVETKGKTAGEGKVFPCYLEGWKQNEDAKVRANPPTWFQACIAQCSGSQFGMVRVVICSDEFGLGKRVWDLPPTEELRNQTPWVASEVPQ